jgi:hypothetical protein
MVQVMTGASTIATNRYDSPVAGRKSIDQIIADLPKNKLQTPVRSLNLCADLTSTSMMKTYYKTLSYAGRELPILPESDPVKAYEYIFGMGPVNLKREKAILDYVKYSWGKSSKEVPRSQADFFRSHMDAISEIETYIQHKREAPKNIYSGEFDFEKTCELQLELIRLAFEADITRVATFLPSPSPSGIDFSQFISGLPRTTHHELTHAKIDHHLVKIFRWYSKQQAKFISGLKSSGLLDSTIVLVMSDLGYVHDLETPPFALFGAGVKPGVMKLKGRSTNDVMLAVLKQFDKGATVFGDPSKCGPSVSCFY